jgi:hypothetical protein
MRTARHFSSWDCFGFLENVGQPPVADDDDTPLQQFDKRPEHRQAA